MASAEFAGDAAGFFAASGWRQFFLNEQFTISLPCNSLAELCKLAPENLNGSLFIDLVSPPDKDKLQRRLLQLETTPNQPISSMMLALLENGLRELPVEIMLYPAPKNNAQISYTGFIRPVPGTVTEFLAEKIGRQLGFKHKQAERVAQLGRHITAILDLGTLLDYVVKSLSQDFGYHYTSIFLVDDNETTLTLEAVSGMPMDATDQLNLVVDNQTIVGHAASTARPIQVNTALQYQYERFNYLSIEPESELAIPVVSGRQVLAVLDVQSDEPNKFQADDLVLLQTISNQLAVAIENARLFEERDRRMAELATFNQIGVALVGHQDLESTLSNILRRVGTLFQVEAVSLMLLEEDGLHFAVAIGEGSEEIKSFVLKPGQGIAWSVVETRQTIRVDNVKADSRHFSDIDTAISFTTNSLLAVPVQIQDRMLGVIEVMNRQDGLPFSRDNEATLEFIASAIAVVLENSRLFDETQQQLNALSTLTQASEAITKAPDLSRLLDIVLDFSLSISGAEAGAIALSDDLMPSTLRIEVARGYEARIIEQFNRLNILYDVGVFGETFRTREILVVEDRDSDPRLSTSAQIAKVLPNSFTNVPLFSQEDFVGVIILHDLPDDRTRSMLKAVADIAAVAIDKARLFGKTNQWLAEVLTLYTLADQLTNVLDLSLNHIIESSVSILNHALDCTNCCIFLNDKSDNSECVKLMAHSGWYESNQMNLELEYITRLAENLIKNPRSLYIEDKEQNPSNRNGISIRSVMMVPLVVKDEVLGALSIDHKIPNAFSHSEERLLTIAAAQISTAIENVRLYSDLEQRATELENALNDLQEANRLKSEFVQNVSHELRTPLTFVLAYVELIREGSLGEVPPEIMDKLEIVSQKTGAITRLVEDVISLQKIEAGNLRFELVTPHQLVSSATSGATASAAEHKLDIISDSPPELPAVLVDVDRIGQVFDNLVGNAIKFSPTGGKISISAERDEDYIKFSVKDYGIGIPADKVEKVFERFYQVDGSTTRRYGGTGLGLAIVRQIVEAHGGQATVESEVNKSTTFSFILPIYKGEVNYEGA